ncbi:membrane protein [Sorangium cellulosum So0157-2]|uniref:Membrane protein n=1 Tax=Sorangium cellulosum So0157-2 TaxID=1254432 RepID=S4Y743_SORCE|nr:membrane protein [Sorangium cellulosum So0157-2]
MFTAFAVFAAFATYFCMYAFRKPFAVGTFKGAVALPLLPDLDLKSLYIIAQVLGYCASKFLGIKVVSEMRPERRALAILACIGVSEAALVLFGLAPAPYAALFLVLNGLPLGMVWGLVFGFLEGRLVSDLLGAGLCASFIVASGFVKTVGKLTLGWGVPEVWMPAVTGALFFPPLLVSVWMLARIPPPTATDEAHRTRRAPMDRAARRAFVLANAGGLATLVLGYIVLTAYRDFRDNFAREIWDALGFADQPAILTTAEIPVAMGALLSVAVMMGIRSNRKALLAVHGIMLGGALLAGVSTALYQAGVIGPVGWMISVGLGLYVGYVPYNCVLFDRLIAAVGSVATAGFLITAADAFGYLGSVVLLLYKSFGQAKLSWLEFFLGFSYATAFICAALFAASAGYFWLRTRALVPAARPALDA